MKNLRYFGRVILLGGGVRLILRGGLGFLLERGLVGRLRFMRYMRHVSGRFIQMDSMSCLFAGVVMYIRGLVSLYGE